MCLADLLPLRNVDYVDARAYHVLHASSGLPEGGLDVLQRLHRLGIHIADANDLSVSAGRRCTRDVHV